MSIICPTVTATDPHSYREQMARIEPFAERVHIDLADGEFAPTKLVSPAQVYWPEHLTADIHIMYKRPHQELETLVSLHPSLVVIHAEADGDLLGMLLELQSFGIKAGIALLADSQVATFEELIGVADHILLFAGKLGYQGGMADMQVLQKIPDVRTINPTAELAWDGGIGIDNAPQLIDGGIDVLNVGGFIQDSENAAQAFKQLQAIISKEA